MRNVRNFFRRPALWLAFLGAILVDVEAPDELADRLETGVNAVPAPSPVSRDIAAHGPEAPIIAPPVTQVGTPGMPIGRQVFASAPEMPYQPQPWIQAPPLGLWTAVNSSQA